jgi:hypothetical protein
MSTAPVTATSRLVALRFLPDSTLTAGTGINLTLNSDAAAVARTIEGIDPTGALATARGLGAGYSRYFVGTTDPSDASFYQSPNLTIQSGGGAISGDANARAFASGRGDTDATALAINVGLANLSYVDRYGAPLLIGSASSPLSATAFASSDNTLGPKGASAPSSSLNATAIVRGLEGSQQASPQPLRPDGQPITSAAAASPQPAPAAAGLALLKGSVDRPLIDARGSGGLIRTDLSLQAPASAGNSIGFYRVVDGNAGVRDSDSSLLYPGEPRYAEVATAPWNLVSELQNLPLGPNGQLQLQGRWLDETSLLAPFSAALPPGDPAWTSAAGTTFNLSDSRPQALPLLDFSNSDSSYRGTLTLRRPEADSDSDASVGLYRIVDRSGAVRGADGSLVQPGDPRYGNEALRPDNLVTEVQGISLAKNVSAVHLPVAIDETSLLAPFALVTEASGQRSTQFSYPSANANGAPSFLQEASAVSLTGLQQLELISQPDPRFTLYGQPSAVVRADSSLNLTASGADQTGNLVADAIGIEAYQIKAVPNGNGDGTATISGNALARLSASGDPINTIGLQVQGQAIGIDGSVLYGAPTLNTTVVGRGVAHADFSGILAAGLAPEAIQLQQLHGIGLRDSVVLTNRGDDLVVGLGGVADAGLPVLSRDSSSAPIDRFTTSDSAGIDRSAIATGMGNDTIFGKVLNEAEAGIDANGDGTLANSVFLDASARNPNAPAGYDGTRHSSVNTGLGDDAVLGSSNGSHFNTEQGNDTINLDRARDSSFWAGLGNDVLSSKGPALANVFWGGLGNDNISVSSGDNNVLDGGLGQDVMSGGEGSDQFVFSEAAGALRATSTGALANDLAAVSLWSSLSESQKETLWDTGVVRNSSGQLLGTVDTVRNFQAGEGGDVLMLSNSLAAITQQLWDSKGAIYGVDSNGKLNVREASADGSNKVGIVVGTLADIQKLGIGSPSLAYATDTRQLMFDADGQWNRGAQSIGTINISSGQLSHNNIRFTGITSDGLGPSANQAGIA